MPTIIEETDVSLERADLQSRSPVRKQTNAKGRCVESTRAKGMHLSGVLRYVALKSNLAQYVDDIDAEALPLRMALGLAWEEFAVSLYPEVDWQPGQVVVDGIAMNCDGLAQDADGKMRLEEFKLTWKRAKSAQELLKQEWYWMQQGRGYCWGYEANAVRWHVCFVNGDYRGSGPIYKRYLIHFTDREIELTQTLITKHREAAAGEGHEE